MPCEMVPLSIDFLKMAAVAMKTAKIKGKGGPTPTYILTFI
jgi:hypothetical protein